MGYNKKVFFVLNDLSEFNFSEYVNKYLEDVAVVIGNEVPSNSKEYDFVILWNYRKIIQNIPYKNNIIVFHSSDLPRGKGWAPIYNTIVNREKYYTISCIFADEQVDSGNVIAKASFAMQDNYTAEVLREWDSEISIIMVAKLLNLTNSNKLVGIAQIGDSTYYSRRYPSDNEIEIQRPFYEIIDHLRACEEPHPAYFYLNEYKYFIEITPEVNPEFPMDIEFVYYHLE